MKRLAIKLVCVIALLVPAMSGQALAAISDEIYSKGWEELKLKFLPIYVEKRIKNSDEFLNYIKTTNPSIEKTRYIVIDLSFYATWNDSETKQRMFGTPFVFYLLKKREVGQITDVHLILVKERAYGDIIGFQKRYKKFIENILAIAQQHNIRVYEVAMYPITKRLLEERFIREHYGLTEQQVKEYDFQVNVKRFSYGDLVELENKMFFRHTADTLIDSCMDIFDKVFEWIENEEQIYKKIEEAKKQ